VKLAPAAPEQGPSDRDCLISFAAKALKDLGDLHYCLGIEVKRMREGLLMTWERYAKDILHWVNMEKCRVVSTPMVSFDKLLVTDGKLLGPKDATQYRSIIGALHYLTWTRPDLSSAVNCVCPFLHCLTTVHWERFKRILWYVKGTLQHGFNIIKSSSLILSGFSDVNWAGCPNDRRSIGGFMIFLGPNLISWSSMKHAIVSSVQKFGGRRKFKPERFHRFFGKFEKNW
jgi:hypothetical protein